jgi:predicted nucleic acid-binding protein
VPVVFVDTVYYVAALVERDALHARAIELSATHADASFVTTDAVLVEVFAQLSHMGPRARAQTVELDRRLRTDPAVTVVRTTDELFDAATMLYADRTDKEYSHTDCLGMLVCRRFDISDVLTHDRHFEQEGFAILM